MKKLIFGLALTVLTFQVVGQTKAPANEKESFSHFVTGQALYNDYQEYKREGSPVIAGYYLGFIVGVLDTINGTYFCLPGGVTQGQAARVVGRYLEENPQRLHFSGARLITEALSQFYPCDNE